MKEKALKWWDTLSSSQRFEAAYGVTEFGCAPTEDEIVEIYNLEHNE